MVVAIAALAVLVLSVRGVMTSAVLLGLAFVALLVIGLGLGIAAHRLPGADRVTADHRALAARPRARPGACATASPWPARPRTVVGALAFSALAWAASTATFLAAGQAVGVELSRGPGRPAHERRGARHDRPVRARLRRARSS